MKAPKGKFTRILIQGPTIDSLWRWIEGLTLPHCGTCRGKVTLIPQSCQEGGAIWMVLHAILFWIDEFVRVRARDAVLSVFACK